MHCPLLSVVFEFEENLEKRELQGDPRVALQHLKGL